MTYSEVSSLKSCQKCREELPSEAYAENRAVCKKCRYNEGILRMSRDEQIFLRRAYSQTKKRAKNKGLDINITSEDLIELWATQGGLCALSGLPMTHHFDNGGTKDYNVSIDRIRSTEGYTITNVQLVCSRVNTIKNDLDEASLFWWVKILHNKLNNVE